LKKDRIVVFPIIISYENDGTDVPYLAEIPAIDGMTQGKSVENAIEMSRDYIGLRVNLMLKNGEKIPKSIVRLPKTDNSEDVVTLVDVNIDEYRRENDNKPVKKTLSIPNYLNEKGIQTGINFSQTLTEALKEKLGV